MKKKLLSVLALASLGIGITLSSCGGNSGNNGENGGNNGDEPPVTDTEKLVSDITLTEESKTLGVGATYQLEWTVAPSDADNKDVTFTSSDTKVATVSEDGLITAVATGTSTITVSSADKSDVTVSFALTVEDAKYIKEIEILNSTSTFTWEDRNDVERVGYEIEMEYTPTYQIEYKVLTPKEEYNNDTLSFYKQSGDDVPCTVSEDGLVTFDEGFEDTVVIFVHNPEQLSHKGEWGWQYDAVACLHITIK